MNIGEASDVVTVLRALTASAPGELEDEKTGPAVERLAQRAGKALQISPDVILRGQR